MNLYKNFCFYSVIAIAIFLFSTANAQLKPHSFGIYGMFGNSFDEAGIVYTLSENIEIDLGIGFQNISYTVDEGEAPESETLMGFYAWGGYFLTKGDVSPYLGIGFDFTSFPKAENEAVLHPDSKIGLEFDFGVQAYVTKNLAFNIEIGMTYDMLSKKQVINDKEYTNGENTFKLFTGGIGATFYFGGD